MRKNPLIIITLFIGLVACEGQQQQPGDALVSVHASTGPELKQDALRYTRGLKLYQQTCAACHGKQGEGAANWQQKDADGKFLPPPLNGTGHTWHHPMYMLMDIIKNGTQRLGGNMPPWKGTLSDKQIQDILYWVQSQWPTEIYAAWYNNNLEVIRNRATAR
jgi:mono/diheme cytochrome c family protein